MITYSNLLHFFLIHLVTFLLYFSYNSFVCVNKKTRKYQQRKEEDKTDLCVHPERASKRYESVHHHSHFLVETSFAAKVTSRNYSKDLVNGALRGNGGVEDAEMAFES